MFGLKGKTITIDAMGTQTEIAKTIINGGGDYLLTLKENQPNLLNDIRLYLNTEIISQKKASVVYHRYLLKYSIYNNRFVVR